MSTPLTDEQLAEIEAREQKATPGPWEPGQPWLVAGVIFNDSGDIVGPKEGTHCAYCNHGPPVIAKRMDINGKLMLGHVHRYSADPEPYEIEHHIAAADGAMVTGNYDYEVGGILAVEDTQFIAHARQDVPALLAEVKRLKTRLAAAEMACLAFGAMGGRMETDREKAAYELWWEWTQLEPRLDSGSTGPLTDDLIEELARRRDAKRDTVTQFLAELGGETS